MDDFNAGDIVELKSGGPDMTIESIDNYSYDPRQKDMKAKCVWFEAKKRHEDIFGLALLKKK
jgi:uncharacterized protein YodC (DUF2158 family)